MKTIRTFVREYRATCLCAALGAALYILSLAFDIDIFEAMPELLQRHEHVEADEIVLAAVILAGGLLADDRRTIAPDDGETC